MIRYNNLYCHPLFKIENIGFPLLYSSSYLMTVWHISDLTFRKKMFKRPSSCSFLEETTYQILFND